MADFSLRGVFTNLGVDFDECLRRYASHSDVNSVIGHMLLGGEFERIPTSVEDILYKRTVKQIPCGVSYDGPQTALLSQMLHQDSQQTACIRKGHDYPGSDAGMVLVYNPELEFMKLISVHAVGIDDPSLNTERETSPLNKFGEIAPFKVAERWVHRSEVKGEPDQGCTIPLVRSLGFEGAKVTSFNHPRYAMSAFLGKTQQGITEMCDLCAVDCSGNVVLIPEAGKIIPVLAEAYRTNVGIKGFSHTISEPVRRELADGQALGATGTAAPVVAVPVK